MPTISITWTLTDQESQLLDRLVAAKNTDAVASYQQRVKDYAALEPAQDPGPAPAPQTRETVVQRIGLKSLRGELERLRDEYRGRNLAMVSRAYDDPAIPQANKLAAIDNFGLRLDGLLLVKK